METGRELLTLEGHNSLISSITVSTDGRRIATGSDDKTAKVWDAETGREILTLDGHTDWVCAVAISADGTRIVTGSNDKSTVVWTLPSNSSSGGKYTP